MQATPPVLRDPFPAFPDSRQAGQMPNTDLDWRKVRIVEQIDALRTGPYANPVTLAQPLISAGTQTSRRGDVKIGG